MNIEHPLELSVVVPVYNNAATLERVYERVRDALVAEGMAFELLFVDDCGPDDSLRVAHELADRYSEVSLIALRHNVGQHAAVLNGLRFAHGECCVVMDADLQDPPEALPLLWHARREDYGAIFAGRRGRYQGVSRMLTSRVYKYVLHRLIGIPKDAGIFVLMERRVVDALLRMPVRTPWINVMIGLNDTPSLSIPVERVIRGEGRSAYNTWGRFYSAFRGLQCVFEYKWMRASKPYIESLDEDPVKDCYGSACCGGDPSSAGSGF